MASSTVAALLFLLIASAPAFLSVHAVDGHHEPNKEDLVAKACANASVLYSRPIYHISQQFCESALRSDKRSAAATHPRDLALVAVDVLQRGAAKAEAMVNREAKQQRGSAHYFTLIELQLCAVDYGFVARTATVCRSMIQDFKPGGDALPINNLYFACANRMRKAAENCLDNSELAEVTNAAWKEMNVVQALAIVYKAMVEQTLGILDIDRLPSISSGAT